MDLREVILQKQKPLPFEEVTIPEWEHPDGGFVKVWIKSLTSAERDAFEAASLVVRKGGKRETDLVRLRARLVIASAVRSPDNPVPLFQDGDVFALGNQHAKALDRLYEVAARLAGIRDADVEELAKNS